jgi:rhomboid protease GluP
LTASCSEERRNFATNKKSNPDDLRNAALSWIQEEKDMLLKLSEKLGFLVNLKNTKKYKNIKEKINIHVEELPRFKIHEKNKAAVFSGIISVSMIIMFLVMEFVQGAFTTEGFIGFGGTQGELIFQGSNFWRLITYYLIHGNPLHLLLNSVLVFYFGSKLERFIKGWEFLVIAFGSSIIAGLFASLLGLIQHTDIVSIGASGIIYGLIGGILIYSRLTNENIAGENTYGILILFLIGIAHGVAVDFVNVGLHIGGFIGGLLITPGVLWNYRTTNKQSEIESDMKSGIGSNIDKKHLE